jgi:DMSO/TMAO reductase YedYZ heme-binding membrane subunit
VIRTSRDRRVVYFVLGLMAAGTAVGLAFFEDLPQVEFLRRFYGFQMYIQLWLILMSTPLLYFHKGRATRFLMSIRAALGNATVFPCLAHLIALLFLQPIYLLNLGNPFDITGTTGSLVIAGLAATSFATPMKRLGPRTWKRLHRWLYVGFAVTTPAALFGPDGARAAPLALVLAVVGYRLAWWVDRKRKGKVPRATRWDRAHGLAMFFCAWAILILSSPDNVENAHEDDQPAVRDPAHAGAE